MGSIQRRLDVEVKIGTGIYLITFFIFNNIQFNCIMGIDTIKKLRFDINFKEGILRIQDNVVKLEGTSQEGINQFRVVKSEKEQTAELMVQREKEDVSLTGEIAEKINGNEGDYKRIKNEEREYGKL